MPIRGNKAALHIRSNSNLWLHLLKLVYYSGVRGVMTYTLYSLLALLKIQMKHYVYSKITANEKQILHFFLLEFPFGSLANFGDTNSKIVERVVQEVV